MASIKTIMEVHDEKKEMIMKEFSAAILETTNKEDFETLKKECQKQLDNLNEYTIQRIRENYLL